MAETGFSRPGTKYTARNVSNVAAEFSDIDTAQRAALWLKQHSDRDALLAMATALFQQGVLPAGGNGGAD